MSHQAKQNAVSDAAAAFAAVEVAINDIGPMIDDLITTIDHAHSAGVGTDEEHSDIVTGLTEDKEKIAKRLKSLMIRHARCTEIAKRENCDVPATYAVEGIITPMGGGTR